MEHTSFWEDQTKDIFLTCKKIMAVRGLIISLDTLAATASFDAMRAAATDSALTDDLRQEIFRHIDNIPGMDGLEIRPGEHFEKIAREHWGYAVMPLPRLAGLIQSA